MASLLTNKQRLLLAELLLDRYQTAPADAHARAVLERDPDNAWAHYLLGAIAGDRSTWDESYGRTEEPMSDLPWNVATGSSSLRVYARPGQPPTETQSAVFADFRKNEEKNAADQGFSHGPIPGCCSRAQRAARPTRSRTST